MEDYKFKIKRLFYPGETEALSPALPSTYISQTSSGVPTGQNCGNCYFNNNGYCNYWNAEIRENYWCKKWVDPQTSQNELPESPPCLTGFTVPIIITEDFNDIGVYTPFDGLVIQRNVINNFLYTADNLLVTVTNTSDTEFKRFLTFGSFNVDWGDGSTDVMNSNPANVTHSYSTPGEYKITVSQVNPWGTTKISKIINLPYTTQVNIPNVFGTVEIKPPNVGSPIACMEIPQNYIYSGDSNPDVYDYFSSNYVQTPFSVTGTTTNNTLGMFQSYGDGSLPPIGQNVALTEESEGFITESNEKYTAYTINQINYTAYSFNDVYFAAQSNGWNVNNLEWECCNEEEYVLGCDCKEFGKTIPKGSWDPNIEYVQGTTVAYDGCCWYCQPKNALIFSCKSTPNYGSPEWQACLPCKDERKSSNVGITSNEEISEYNPAINLQMDEKVYYQGNTYTFKGTRVIDVTTNIQTLVEGCPSWIDLTYVDSNTQDIVPYQDSDGVVWAGGYTTNPTFNLSHWENISGINLLTYSLWQ
tara:strand:- start:316 stop:1902 length:1587 start_codon:yes stop_codon:yes gene_type:complete